MKDLDIPPHLNLTTAAVPLVRWRGAVGLADVRRLPLRAQLHARLLVQLLEAFLPQGCRPALAREGQVRGAEVAFKRGDGESRGERR